MFSLAARAFTSAVRLTLPTGAFQGALAQRDQPRNMVVATCSRIKRGISDMLARLYGTVEERQYTVIVEGNIGSGKTSLLQHFTASPSAQVIQEPVTRWRNIDGHNALKLMYEDPHRWSLTFQTYVQLTMLQTHHERQEKPVKLMERSIYSAKYCFAENLHESGKMPDIEYIILGRWFDWIVETQRCNVDLIVYLQTRPEVVHERIKKRCRKEETAIPLTYLQALHDLHENWLINKSTFPLPAPVLVLDANADYPEMVKIYEANRERILFNHT